MEQSRDFPITFVDYTFMVPAPGLIIFDAELNPEQIFVRDGDTFEAIVKDGRLTFRGVSRRKSI